MEPIDEEAGSDPIPGPAPRRRQRWPLGTLTLIVIGFVAIGLLLVPGASDSTSSAGESDGGALGLPTRNGDMAPDFTLTMMDGESFSLSDHFVDDGRPVFLNLWASWCAPCRAEMPALDAASKNHVDVLFLGVAVEDDPDAARAFAAEIGVSYPLAIDEAGRVARRYPSPGLPATFLIGTTGVIARTVFGQLNEDQIDSLIAEAFGA